LEKIVGGAHIPGGVYASKSWPLCGECKNFGVQHLLEAEIWYSEKVNFMGTTEHNKLCG